MVLNNFGWTLRPLPVSPEEYSRNAQNPSAELSPVLRIHPYGPAFTTLLIFQVVTFERLACHGAYHA